MEANIEKALDNRRRIGLNLKRKRASRCAAYFTEATRPEFSSLPTLNKLGKRRKLKGCRRKSTTNESHFGRSLLKCYLNFKKSGLPQRLMFYQNGDWTDLSGDIVEMVKRDLLVKKPFSEIVLNGRSYVLDFLHMFKVNMETGFQQPIAWIDEAGRCFFPETFAIEDDDAEPHLSCTYETGDNQKPDFAESCGSRDIKFQLEIEINGVGNSMFRECSGESNALVKKIHIEQLPASNPYVADAEDSCNGEPTIKVDETVKDNREMESKSLSLNESVDGKLDCDTVRKLFLNGMGSFSGPDIVDIYPCKSSLLQSRWELFEKQAEITRKCRGNANVQYAWLASSKEAISALTMHGLGYSGSSTVKSKYGIGIHVTASGYPSIRFGYFHFPDS